MRRGLGQIEEVVVVVLMAEAIFTGSKYSKTVAVEVKVCDNCKTSNHQLHAAGIENTSLYPQREHQCW